MWLPPPGCRRLAFDLEALKPRAAAQGGEVQMEGVGRAVHGVLEKDRGRPVEIDVLKPKPTSH
jgi:hypothetical protein